MLAISLQKPIVFFDGVCGLCNRFVDFAMRIDKRHVLCFAPLQGVTAKRILRTDGVEIPDSIVFFDDNDAFYKSDAVLRICKRIGGFWWFFAIMCSFIPRPIRDVVYDFIATHRYQWFGKRDTCRMPTEDEKKYLLL